jgi:hypothetical protein
MSKSPIKHTMNLSQYMPMTIVPAMKLTPLLRLVADYTGGGTKSSFDCWERYLTFRRHKLNH